MLLRVKNGLKQPSKEKRMDMNATVWLTRKQLAERLGIPPKTLAEWASKGIGPRYARFGRHVRYLLRDVLEWESGRRIGPRGQTA